jgi:hypothetical protein
MSGLHRRICSSQKFYSGNVNSKETEFLDLINKLYVLVILMIRLYNVNLKIILRKTIIYLLFLMDMRHCFLL